MPDGPVVKAMHHVDYTATGRVRIIAALKRAHELGQLHEAGRSGVIRLRSDVDTHAAHEAAIDALTTMRQSLRISKPDNT